MTRKGSTWSWDKQEAYECDHKQTDRQVNKHTNKQSFTHTHRHTPPHQQTPVTTEVTVSSMPSSSHVHLHLGYIYIVYVHMGVRTRCNAKLYLLLLLLYIICRWNRTSFFSASYCLILLHPVLLCSSRSLAIDSFVEAQCKDKLLGEPFFCSSSHVSTTREKQRQENMKTIDCILMLYSLDHCPAKLLVHSNFSLATPFRSMYICCVCSTSHSLPPFFCLFIFVGLTPPLF